MRISRIICGILNFFKSAISCLEEPKLGLQWFEAASSLHRACASPSPYAVPHQLGLLGAKQLRRKVESPFANAIIAMEIIAITKFRGDVEWVRLGLFCFKVARRRGTTLSYVCGTADCGAAFKVRRGVGPLQQPQHNHDPEIWIPNRNQMFQNLKSRSAGEVLDLHIIYLEEAARYPDAAPHLPYEAVLPSMRKWRRAVQPPVPRTLAEYGIAIANQPAFRHLHLATVSAGEATAVILGMPGFGEVLRAADSIIADGTFKTVPAGLPACQILTLHATCMTHFYHPVIAFMTNRRQDLYEAVLRRVWDLAENPRPDNIITDYEIALQQALRQVTGLPVSGCYFHFLQALTRQARRLHINVGRNTSGARLVRLYGVLALLPAERVPAALRALPQAASSLELAIHDGFNDYFVTQWMGRVTPECFSVYGRAHRTSNVAENYHSFLGRNLGPGPNVWAFTNTIAAKFQNCAARRQAQLSGRPGPIRRNRLQQMVRLAMVAQNNSALSAGVITIEEFLINTSGRINMGLGLVANEVPDMAEEVEVVEQPLPVDLLEEVPLPQPLPAPAPEPAGAGAGPRCGICLDAPPTRVLIPCGHTMCEACLLGIQQAGGANQEQCPYCRMHIRSCITIYL